MRKAVGTHSFAATAACGMLSLMLHVASPAPARACTYIPVDPVLITDRIAPEGPIFVMLRCTHSDYCDVGEPTLKVSSSGEPAEGTLHLQRSQVGLFMAWAPRTPLEEGAVVDIEFEDPTQQPPGELSGATLQARVDGAVEAQVPDLDMIDASLEEALVSTGPEHCCHNPLACADVDYCFSESAVSRPSLKLNETPNATPAFLFRMRWREADGSEKQSAWTTGLSGARAVFHALAEEYCLTVEMLDLVEGTRSQRELCRSPSDTPSFGERRPPEWKTNPDRLWWCHHHPPGTDAECDPRLGPCAVAFQPMLEAWCQAQACEEDSDHCARVEAYCSEVAPPPTHGDAGPRPVADAQPPEAHDGGPAHDAKLTASSCGSCATAGDVGALSPWVLALVGWVTRIRRRVRACRG